MKISKVLHFILRLIIFVFSLVVSTAILLAFLSKIPNNPVMQTWAKVITILFEGGMAYVLSLALGYWKRGYWLAALLLFACYGTYIYVAVNSAQMLFMTELSQKETTATAQEETHDTNKDLYDRAKADSDQYKRLMDAEEKTGAKTKFKEWESKKKAADDDMKYYAGLMRQGNQIAATVQNIQSDFAKYYPNDWQNRLKTIFIILMGAVYLFQILTTWPWPFEEKGVGATKSNNTNGATPFLEKATPPATGVADDLILCAYSKCGESFPYVKGKEYCDDKCRNAAFKERQKIAKIERRLGYQKPEGEEV